MPVTGSPPVLSERAPVIINPQSDNNQTPSKWVTLYLYESICKIFVQKYPTRRLVSYQWVVTPSNYFLLRASVSSQKPGLINQRHSSLPAVDASCWYGRQEGHHLQHPVPALWWKRWQQWGDTVWAVWAGPEVHPTATWSDRYLGGNNRFCDARQLHLPCRGCERRLWAGRGSAITGECYRHHTPSRWVADIFFTSVQLQIQLWWWQADEPPEF